MSSTTIITPPDDNSGEAFDHVEGPTQENNQAAYHTRSQGPAPPPAPEPTRSRRPSGPANPPPEDDTTSDEGDPPPREPPTSLQLPAIDPVALTNLLAATVRSRKDKIATLQNQIGILINQNQHLMNKQDRIMCMLQEEMERNESRRASRQAPTPVSGHSRASQVDHSLLRPPPHATRNITQKTCNYRQAMHCGD